MNSTSCAQPRFPNDEKEVGPFDPDIVLVAVDEQNMCLLIWDIWNGLRQWKREVLWFWVSCRCLLILKAGCEVEMELMGGDSVVKREGCCRLPRLIPSRLCCSLRIHLKSRHSGIAAIVLAHAVHFPLSKISHITGVVVVNGRSWTALTFRRWCRTPWRGSGRWCHDLILKSLVSYDLSGT